MQRIAVVGAGFSGTLLCARIIEGAQGPMEIYLLNTDVNFYKGTAYNSYSNTHLLNVPVGKMSAYPEFPNHFLEYLKSKKEYEFYDSSDLAQTFVSRKDYGEYLEKIGRNMEAQALGKSIAICKIQDSVENLDKEEDRWKIQLRSGQTILVDFCVLATGNQLPRNPSIPNDDFYKSSSYFQNPWNLQAVLNLDKTKPIWIIGNGLTMVDTVLGLLEHGFDGQIYTLSPHGYSIIAHKKNGVPYADMVRELPNNVSLYTLFQLFNHHTKKLKAQGITAEALVDSIRPHTQRIWKGFSQEEKALFMRRFRHLWGVARHRIPQETHEKIQALRNEDRLHSIAGKIVDMNDSDDGVSVSYIDHSMKKLQKRLVSRVINCTGPETDMMRLEGSFLKKALIKGVLSQDPLKLGLRTDTDSFGLIDAAGIVHGKLFTIGSTLKGELWESTAVNELREQASLLATKLVQQIDQKNTV